jgi:hypothetical protein
MKTHTLVAPLGMVLEYFVNGKLVAMGEAIGVMIRWGGDGAYSE